LHCNFPRDSVKGISSTYQKRYELRDELVKDQGIIFYIGTNRTMEEFDKWKIIGQWRRMGVFLSQIHVKILHLYFRRYQKLQYLKFIAA
jgi:hypothetical protein